MEIYLPKIHISPIIGLTAATIGTAASSAGGAAGLGGLLAGAGSIMGSTGGDEGLDPPWQSDAYFDYWSNLNYQKNLEILKRIREQSYEGFEGSKNIQTTLGGFVQSMGEEPPPNYFASGGKGIPEQAQIWQEGGPAPSVGPTGETGFAPFANMQLAPEDLTEWDQIAKDNGIVVTQFHHFKDPTSLQRELYAKNYGEVTVATGEMKTIHLITQAILNKFAPQLGEFYSQSCGGGQCVDWTTDILASLKARIRTKEQMGDDFNPLIVNRD